MKSTKFIKIAAIAAVIVFALSLAACGKQGTIGVDFLDEADGVKVTAENANSDQVTVAAQAFTVDEGEVVVISPCLDNGSFHLKIEGTNGGAVLYDEDVDGRVLFTIEAAPGVYDVTANGNGGTTGWMTVFSQSAAEISNMDAALDEALAQNNMSAEDIKK